MENRLLYIVIPVVSFLLILSTGCGLEYSIGENGKPVFRPDPNSEKIFAAIDQIAHSIPVITESGKAALETPAGQLVPEPVKKTVGLVGYGLLALSNLWLYIRKQHFKNGFSELAFAEKLFLSENSTGNKDLHNAQAKALNPPTLNLLTKAGYDSVRPDTQKNGQ